MKAQIFLLVLGVLLLPCPARAEPAAGIAMHGEPARKKAFTSYAYVNPAAPKGGRATFAEQGSFDSLNPLIVKGAPAAGVRE